MTDTCPRCDNAATYDADLLEEFSEAIVAFLNSMADGIVAAAPDVPQGIDPNRYAAFYLKSAAGSLAALRMLAGVDDPLPQAPQPRDPGRVEPGRSRVRPEPAHQ